MLDCMCLLKLNFDLQNYSRSIVIFILESKVNIILQHFYFNDQKVNLLRSVNITTFDISGKELISPFFLWI